MKLTFPIPANRFLGGSATLRGMGFMLASTLSWAAMLASVRHVATSLHPYEVLLFRFLISVLIFLPVVIARRLEPLKTARPGMHVLRSALIVVAMLAFFLAVTMTPLAKLVALQFSAPLFTTVLAMLLLRETIRARRISGLIVGFAGTMVILRPGFVALDLGSLLVLFSSLMWALTMIVIKVQSRTESALTMTIYSTLFSLPFSLLAALPYWQTPTLPQLGWCVVIAGLGITSNLAFAQAFKEADVTAVLPLYFTQLIWVAVIGYLLFAEIPDVWTWVGGIMICSAVTYIAVREKRVKGDKPVHVTPSSVH